MPGFLGALGMQAATNAINAGMGLALERHNDRRQLAQERRLQGIQMANERQMVDYNMAKQFEMWQKTSYPGQIEMMKKAGLNPSMLYGMSGGGGITTGSPTGNVSSGDAPKGGGEAMGMMLRGVNNAAEIALLNAQKENIEADTELKRAGKPKAEAETVEIQARTGNINVDTKLKEAELKIKNATSEDLIDIVNSHKEILVKQLDQEIDKAAIIRATRNVQIEKINQELANMISEKALKDAQKLATEAHVEQEWVKIEQEWEKLTQNLRAMDQKDVENSIKAFEADLKSKYPGAWNVVGRMLNDAGNALGSLYGGQDNIGTKPTDTKNHERLKSLR